MINPKCMCRSGSEIGIAGFLDCNAKPDNVQIVNPKPYDITRKDGKIPWCDYQSPNAFGGSVKPCELSDKLPVCPSEVL